MRPTTVILFLNIGGPENLSQVRPFLYRLFEDPEVLRINFSPLRKIIAWFISTFREKTSQAMYEKIGGGSPIRKLTDLQVVSVEKKLKERGYDYTVKTAFTCSDPLVEDVVKSFSGQNIKCFINLPLYPQYSFTTTRGAYDRTRKAVRKVFPQAEYREIPSFPKHGLFLEAHADQIRDEIKKFSDPEDPELTLVFSAHSIPKKLVTEEGDPYEKEMKETVGGILEKLNWKRPWRLSWQSKLGPIEWLSPGTDETLRHLGREGIKRVLAIPIAFVTDHIETLFEIDQLLAGIALEAGIKEFRRTPGLNDQPKFISCLVDLILTASRPSNS